MQSTTSRPGTRISPPPSSSAKLPLKTPSWRKAACCALAEQAMAPVDRCAERLLARRRASGCSNAAAGSARRAAPRRRGCRAAGSATRPARSPALCRQACGRARARWPRCRRRRGAPVGRLQALVEERDRAVAQGFGGLISPAARHVEAAEPEHALLCHVQRHLARDQHAQRRARRWRSASAMAATASTRCSALSSKSSASSGAHGGEQRGSAFADRPRARPPAPGDGAGAAPDPRLRPVRPCDAIASALAQRSRTPRRQRVLPMPPAPAIVTSRCSPTSASKAALSWALPTSGSGANAPCARSGQGSGWRICLSADRRRCACRLAAARSDSRGREWWRWRPGGAP